MAFRRKHENSKFDQVNTPLRTPTRKLKLQLGGAEECEEVDHKKLNLITHQPGKCSSARMTLKNTKSVTSINRKTLQQNTNQERSSAAHHQATEVPYEDELMAVALIIDHLKIKQQPSSSRESQPQQNQSGHLHSKWKAGLMEKSKSAFQKSSSSNYNLQKPRAQSFHLGTKFGRDRPMKGQSKEKEYMSPGQIKNDSISDIVIEKELVDTTKVKMSGNLFNRMTGRILLHSKTIAETSKLEIKEMVTSEKDRSYQQNTSKNCEAKTGFRKKISCITNDKADHQALQNRKDVSMTNIASLQNRKEVSSTNIPILHSIKDVSLTNIPSLPDVAAILNPNMLDEVTPYVLRFVKRYLGDFRQYLLDAFIGVDSISLDHFESMVKAIDDFPIDDLTLFKNIKYSLATLFPHDENNLNDSSRTNKPQDINKRYQANLMKKNVTPPPNICRYKIKVRQPVNLDVKAMGDSPSFLVRYYPTSNKLHRNQCSQTDNLRKTWDFVG